MKILTFVKQVPTAASGLAVDDAGTRIVEDRLAFEANEPDLYALEEALHQVQTHGGEVIAATIGPARAKDVLHVALAKGASSVIQVLDEANSGRDPQFNLAAARVVVERVQPDLILCGVQAQDDMFGQFGALLAGALDVPLVSAVTQIDVDPDAGKATALREMGGGYREELRVALPSVMTVQFGIRPLRYTSIMAIVKMKRHPIDAITVDAAPNDSSRFARVAGYSQPPSSAKCEFFAGDTDTAVTALLKRLKDKGALTNVR